MKIDGIDYVIVLFVEDENENSIEDHVFLGFEQLNAFIRNNKTSSYYTNKRFKFAFAESPDMGKHYSFSSTVAIPFEEFTEATIQQEVQFYRDELTDSRILAEKIDTFSKEIHYVEPSENYKRKQQKLEDYVYVCPNCLRTIDDCRCERYPQYLVQIDRLILPVIQELNESGYRTTGCCAGHIKDGQMPSFLGIYIRFDQEYDFDEPFPEGTLYFKEGNVLRVIEPEDGCMNPEEFQQEAIWKLSDWAEILSDIEEIED